MNVDKPEEPIAQAVLERELEVSLERPRLTDGQTPDYVSQRPPHAVQIKRFTSEQQMWLLASSDQHELSIDTDELSRRWAIVIDVPTTSDQFPKTPDFPRDPSAEEQARWAEAGRTVVPRAERVRLWEAERSLPLPPPPKLKNLARDLIPFLSALEQAGVNTTHGLVPWEGDPAVKQAVAGILQRARNSMCTSFSPTEVPSGVDVHLAWGGARSGQPNELVDRICRWLNSDVKQAVKLRASLENVEPGTHRHAFVVLDSASEPEWWEIQNPEFVPTSEPDLPAEVDWLWVMAGDVTLKFYDRRWSRLATRA